METIKSITVRENVTVSDTANPAVSTGAAVGYDKVIVEVILSGTDPQASVTPLFLDSTGTGYSEGETTVVSGAKNHRFELKTSKWQNVNFRIDSLAGTNPSVTIKIIKDEAR